MHDRPYDRSQPVLSALDLNDNGSIDLAGTDRISGSQQRVEIANGKAVLRSEAFVYPDIGTASPRTVSTSLAAADGNDIWNIFFGRTNHFHVVRDPAAKRRTETTTRPDGTQLIQVYTNGLLHSTEARDADGVTLTQRLRTYDAFNRLAVLDEASPDGSRRLIRYSYDAAGQITNTTVSAGQLSQSTSISFDNMGRPLQVVYPDGGIVQRVYNARGQIVEQSGARTYPVRYSYDALGRMQSLSTFREGFDGPADVTRWHYDPARGFMTAKEFADGSTNRFVYRPDGSIAQRHWARGVVTSYQYDRSGTVTNTSYSDDTPSVSYTYDRLGRPVTVRDGIGQHERTYNVDGSIGQESAPQRPNVALQRHYDGFGRYTGYLLLSNLTSLATIDYGYDRAGRLATVAAPGLSVAYSYGADAVSLTNSAYLGSGYHVARTYDALGRVSSIQNRNAAGLIEQSAYTLNAANQRTRQTLADGRYWDYDYDDLGQLVSGKAKQPDGTQMGGRQFEYDYDRIGNRIESQNQRGLQTQKSEYTANALNQYEQRTVPGELFVSGTVSNALRVTVSDPDNASSILANRTGKHFWAALPVNNAQDIAVLTNITILALSERIEPSVTNLLTRTETRSAILPKTPETYTYDADGNTLSDGLWHYAWNAENRLTNMTSVSALPPEHRLNLTFAYDYLGRRVRKTVINETQGTTNQTTYLYNGWNIIAETTAQNDFFYFWGQDLSGTLSAAGGVGGLLAVYQATNLYHCAYDGNGNITAYLTADGIPVATREYTPFGQTLSQTGPQFTHWFSTKPQDPESTHYAYTFRYYNSTKGRFYTRDPVEETGGFNLYAFVGNRPVSVIDPLGLEWGDSGLFPDWASTPGTIWGARFDDFTDIGGPIFDAGKATLDFGQAGLTASRVGLGYVPSVLSGDIFDESLIQTEFNSNQCEFLITINGIGNDDAAARSIRDLAAERFGVPSVRVVNDTHLFAVGDVLQILGHEVGLIDVTSRRAARQIEEAYNWGRQQGCSCLKITVLAHSQGTMVFKRALPLLSPEVRQAIDYHGDGGETFIGPGEGLGSVENSWNRSEGKGFPFGGWDPVPVVGTYLNPLKLFGIPFHLGGGEVDHLNTPVDSQTGDSVSGNNHSWLPFYSWQY